MKTMANASPVFEDSGTDDKVAYERNTKALLEEYKRQRPNHKRMYHILKLTHAMRRIRINNCLVPSLELLKEYQFFQQKKWVSISTITFSLYLVGPYY